jgi:hypothetical protein
LSSGDTAGWERSNRHPEAGARFKSGPSCTRFGVRSDANCKPGVSPELNPRLFSVCPSGTEFWICNPFAQFFSTPDSWRFSSLSGVVSTPASTPTPKCRRARGGGMIRLERRGNAGRVMHGDYSFAESDVIVNSTRAYWVGSEDVLPSTLRG